MREGTAASGTALTTPGGPHIHRAHDDAVVSGKETYRRLARFYDLYAGDFDADLPLYLALCTPRHRILEIGCGTGRVLAPLLARGYTVTGVDISTEMLRLAAARLAGPIERRRLDLVLHDFSDGPLAPHFDRILVTYYTFNYLLEHQARTRFLRNVTACLAADGVLIMDLFYPRPLEKKKQSDRWREYTLEGNGRRVKLRQRKRMLGDVEERVQVFEDGAEKETVVTRRCYVDKQRADALLREAGFGRIEITEGYELDRLHPLSESESTQSAFVCVARGLG